MTNQKYKMHRTPCEANISVSCSVIYLHNGLHMNAFTLLFFELTTLVALDEGSNWKIVSHHMVKEAYNPHLSRHITTS